MDRRAFILAGLAPAILAGNCQARGATVVRVSTSDELVAAHRDYYLRAIDCFGPERCMFESNFPVDRQAVSYPVLWNAFKKLAAPFSEDEKHSLFWGTATSVYRL